MGSCGRTYTIHYRICSFQISLPFGNHYIASATIEEMEKLMGGKGHESFLLHMMTIQLLTFFLLAK